uniref:Lipase_3 domain-containing protein n=1 Tax=Panagrellus redivivus TaxID=6233 RepID=A0A7E4VPQ7_PANRE
MWRSLSVLLVFLAHAICRPPTQDDVAALFDASFISESPANNWTIDYDRKLAEFALDFAAAAYSKDPTPCLAKNNATLIRRVQVPCDYIDDQCWAFVARSEEWIIFAVRGTKTKLQLITELVESMTAPKMTFPAGGSVQRYFYSALQSLWKAGFGALLKDLKVEFPKAKMLFTGHSLGGALASLASSMFAYEHPTMAKPDEVFLITFGQPRVGNILYAAAHDKIVPNSWRLVHSHDIVPHLPYCFEDFWTKCTAGRNHTPYHHGTEIWYPEDMNNSSIFRICTAEPINEDASCSNEYYVHFNIIDHLAYLGKDVDLHGTTGCKDTRRAAKKRYYMLSNRTKP